MKKYKNEELRSVRVKRYTFKAGEVARLDMIQRVKHGTRLCKQIFHGLMRKKNYPLMQGVPSRFSSPQTRPNVLV